MLFEDQAVGPVAAAITGAVEKLLQLLPNPLGRQACVLFNQTNQLIHTPPCGFKGVLSKIRPALLDRRQQAFKALTEVVLESAVGLRRWRGHEDRWQDALEG